MKRTITNRDTQRIDFVDNLYSNLRKTTREAIDTQKKLASKASVYVNDGLEDDECVELLILDGLSREAASSYVSMVKDNEFCNDDGLYEYSFTFEDSFGKLVSSHEINKIIKASNDQDAMIKAEEFMSDDVDYDMENIISVNRLDD